MVSYTCNKCKKEFNNKLGYDRHNLRTTNCTATDNSKFVCKNCNKAFCRKDSLRRHYTVCQIHKEEINTNNNATGTQNVNNGDHNNINNITINLMPFGQDGITSLSTLDRLAIFSSNKNPMEEITLKVNLNPDKPEHHNVGIPDMHSGYGIIYDGKEWLDERINNIIDVLLTSKEKDLSTIYNQLKNITDKNFQKENDISMENLRNIIYPTNKKDKQSKKLLVAHLKKHLYNKRKFAIDAKHNTKQIQSNENNPYKNILKKGLTLEDADKHIKKIEMEMPQVECKKEIATYLLDRFYKNKIIDDDNYKEISKRISECIGLNEILTLINYLCSAKNINIYTINNKIKQNEKIEKYYNKLVTY